MREIKFRVWDGKARKMLPLTSIEMCTDGAMCVGYGYRFESIVGEDDVHLMQFTGLKDSKGVYIYEGDAIKYNTWTSGQDHHWRNGLIIFKDGRFEVEGLISLTLAGVNRKEVIGNIYENPDLLEDIKGAA